MSTSASTASTDSVPEAALPPELLENPGYHVTRIARGTLGELSKVREELCELEDAMAQGSRIMAAVEVADLVGALQAFLAKHLPGVTLDDAVQFSAITQRAFRNGHRASR